MAKINFTLQITTILEFWKLLYNCYRRQESVLDLYDILKNGPWRIIDADECKRSSNIVGVPDRNGHPDVSERQKTPFYQQIEYKISMGGKGYCISSNGPTRHFAAISDRCTLEI